MLIMRKLFHLKPHYYASMKFCTAILCIYGYRIMTYYCFFSISSILYFIMSTTDPYKAYEVETLPLPTPEASGFFDSDLQAVYMGALATGIRTAHAAVGYEPSDLAAHVAIGYEHKRAVDAMNQEVNRRDPLTSLHTRAYLTWAYDKLQTEEHSSSSRRTENPSNEPVSLLIVDVDHFKEVNTDHGHVTGDKALRATAQAMSRMVRETDTIIRYGGGEFVAMLPRASEENAKKVAEIMRAAISHETFSDKDGRPLTVTASIGVAEIDLKDTLAGNLERADQALYEAKSSGRNQVIGFSELPTGKEA